MARGAPLPTKDCAVCGRTITWRKKWERDWDQVLHCSDGCRRRARSGSARGLDEALDEALATLLRARGASVDPGALAAAVASAREDVTAADLAEPARAAARRLVAAGAAQIVQGGRVVDPSTARGPFRVRRPR